MKKFLLSISILATMVASIGCSQQAKWNHKQKEAMREALRQYRNMVYLQDLTDAEFILFSDGVAMEIENAYPAYSALIELPSPQDTVDIFVVETIVDELNADAHNMRHIFPYRYLVSQGVLPDKLTHEQQRSFYKCFAQKVNGYYDTMEGFFNAILADTTNNSQLSKFQQECASDLFDWVVTIEQVEVE